MTNFFSQRTEERRKKVASFFRRYPKCNTEWNAGTFVYMECFYCCRMRNIEGPASLSPPSLFHHEKKGGQYGEILLPTFRKKREGCLFHYKLKIKRKARNLSLTGSIHPRSEIVLNVSLS